MPKIDIDALHGILQRNEPDIRKVADIMHEVKMQIQAEEEERANRPPAVKKQFVILLSDAQGDLARRDITGWVLQIPEEDNPASARERVVEAAYDFNTTPKGRRLPVRTIGEACEAVSPKSMKERRVWVKTKTPVLAIATPNALPTQKVE